MSTPYQNSRNFASVNGVSLHYALDGKDTYPLLVLVNMASHNLTCWEVVMAPLLESFQVLRFDIRGTGKSTGGKNDDYTFSQYGDDLVALMDVLDLDKALVVGVAYGSRTVARLALNHPTRLLGVGMFDVALTPPVEQKGQHDLARQAMALLKQAGEPLVALQKYWRFYEDRATALLAHTAHESEPDVTAQLASVNLPVLIACGEQDMNLGESKRIAQAVPSASFSAMAMAGHCSVFYRPQLFVQLIQDFYRKQCV